MRQISGWKLGIEKYGWDLFHGFVKIEVMKNIEIIPIARKKLERRGISEEWIKETINSPDQMVDGYGGRRVAQKKYIIESKEYLLRVVYEEQGNLGVVITAYLSSQIMRYWKEEKDEDRV